MPVAIYVIFEDLVSRAAAGYHLFLGFYFFPSYFMSYRSLRTSFQLDAMLLSISASERCHAARFFLLSFSFYYFFYLFDTCCKLRLQHRYRCAFRRHWLSYIKPEFSPVTKLADRLRNRDKVTQASLPCTFSLLYLPRYFSMFKSVNSPLKKW